MLVNDLAKQMEIFGVEETIEVLSRIVRVLENIKSREPLPSGLVRSFLQLFEVDSTTGTVQIESISIDSLCLLCRINQAVDLLNLTKDESKSNLSSIEHTILMNHNDSLSELNPAKIVNLVFAFGYQHMQSELLYLLEPHILKQVRDFQPNQLARVCSYYLHIGQGKAFLKHAMIAVALSSDQC